MKRTNFSSGTPWEENVGYSRAVRAGNQVFVSGTTASDENGKVHGVGDAYAQTVYILEKIKKMLQDAGCGVEDVVRTRMFVTDMANWEKIGAAHQEMFADIRPAATMVEVLGLVNPEHLVEIEVDALVV